MSADLDPSRSTRDYQDADAAHHIHAFVDQKALNAEGPRVMVSGERLALWDNDGKRYLDACGGAAVSCLGHSDAAVIAAVQQQAGFVRTGGLGRGH